MQQNLVIKYMKYILFRMKTQHYHDHFSQQQPFDPYAVASNLIKSRLKDHEHNTEAANGERDELMQSKYKKTENSPENESEIPWCSYNNRDNDASVSHRFISKQKLLENSLREGDASVSRNTIGKKEREDEELNVEDHDDVNMEEDHYHQKQDRTMEEASQPAPIEEDETLNVPEDLSKKGRSRFVHDDVEGALVATSNRRFHPYMKHQDNHHRSLSQSPQNIDKLIPTATAVNGYKENGQSMSPPEEINQNDEPN